MSHKIPISVIIVTRGEAHNLPRCLSALTAFDEVVIVDSHSADDSAAIAARFGAGFVPYEWNGHYPKKRQWCLDNLPLKHERVFFVDADEEVTPAVVAEIAALDWACAGYFVRGRYVCGGRPLRFGLSNNKLVLFDRRKAAYPVVDDLDIPGMGEIEGHYQPMLAGGARAGQIKAALLHYAGEGAAWHARHEGYAAWEAQMIMRGAYPAEHSRRRTLLKKLFRTMICRGECAFIHSYVLKGGFLDGATGFQFARSRWLYYRMVTRALSAASTAQVSGAAASMPRTARQK